MTVKKNNEVYLLGGARVGRVGGGVVAGGLAEIVNKIN